MPNVSNAPPTTTTFRDLVSHAPPDGIAPTFLLGPVGSRFLYPIAEMFDGLTDAAGYAVRARFPSLAPADAYSFLGLDRLIQRGPNEASASYVQRLIQWLDLHRHEGSATAVLLATLAACSPKQPRVLTVQNPGAGGSPDYTTWYTYVAGATPFPAGQSNPTPPDLFVSLSTQWRWDSLSLPFYAPWMFWRTWVVVFSTGTQAPWAAPTATWGSFHWGDGTCLGWAGTAAQGAALTLAAKQWKSAGTWVPWVLVSYDDTYFDQTQAFGSAKLPDGHWGFYGKVVADAAYGTKYVSARLAASTVTYVTGSNDGGGVLGVG